MLLSVFGSLHIPVAFNFWLAILICCYTKMAHSTFFATACNWLACPNCYFHRTGSLPLSVTSSFWLALISCYYRSLARFSLLLLIKGGSLGLSVTSSFWLALSTCYYCAMARSATLSLLLFSFLYHLLFIRTKAFALTSLLQFRNIRVKYQSRYNFSRWLAPSCKLSRSRT